MPRSRFSSQRTATGVTSSQQPEGDLASYKVVHESDQDPNAEPSLLEDRRRRLKEWEAAYLQKKVDVGKKFLEDNIDIEEGDGLAAAGGSEVDATSMAPPAGSAVDPLDSFMSTLAHDSAMGPNISTGKGETSSHSSSKGMSSTTKGGKGKGKGKGGGVSMRERYHSEDEELLEIIGEESSEEEDMVAVLAKKLNKRELKKVDHSQMDYPPRQKNFYALPPEQVAWTPAQIAECRLQLENIVVKGSSDCPPPTEDWSACGLPANVVHFLREERGYQRLTPIQAQALPALMRGLNVIGIAPTGCGKTLAFLLPMMRHLLHAEPPSHAGGPLEAGPLALVLCPTRELCVQLYWEAKKLFSLVSMRGNVPIGVCVAFGGAGFREQVAALKNLPAVVVATPGRWLDLLTTNKGKLTHVSNVSFLVLDEADRMFDMGFEPQVTKIVGNIRPDKQLALFSATFPPALESLAKQILQLGQADPAEKSKPKQTKQTKQKQTVTIMLKGRSTVPSSVEQVIEVLREEEKFPRLISVIRKYIDATQILIFVATQSDCDVLFKELMANGLPSVTLHGGKEQSDRADALHDFKLGKFPLMIATSLASRGLDVSSLKLVINYDCPNHLEDYVHRCGRTGRAGNAGLALTFVTEDDAACVPHILRALEDSKAPIPAPLTALHGRYETFRKEQKSQKRKFMEGFSNTRGYAFSVDEEASRRIRKKVELLEYGVEHQEEEGINISKEAKLLETVQKKHGKLLSKELLSADAKAAITSASMEQSRNSEVFEQLSTQGPSNDTMDGRNKSNRHGENDTSNENEKDKALITRQQMAAIEAARAVASAITSEKGLAPQQSSTQAMRSALAITGGTDAAERVRKAQQLAAQFARGNAALSGLVDDPENAEASSANGGASLEIEINDYPQAARWKVTQKGGLDTIMEYTNCAVTSRGVFVAPGKNPPTGERKLHFVIEGPNQRSVDICAREIKKILEEVTLKQQLQG